MVIPETGTGVDLSIAVLTSRPSSLLPQHSMCSPPRARRADVASGDRGGVDDPGNGYRGRAVGAGAVTERPEPL